MTDTTVRSVAKTISWRLCGTGATLGISWLITGSITIASSIAAVQLIFNTVLYFVHERCWNKIRWGRS